MSDKTRLEAAAQQFHDHVCREDRHSGLIVGTACWDYKEEAQAVLVAADAHDTANGVHRVSLDEATVGRVMNALYDHREGALSCYDHHPTPGNPIWCCVCGEHEIAMSHRQHAARAALAAAVKEEQ